MSPQAADTVAVVVNWRTHGLTVRAARALVDAGLEPGDVVVVDNGSGPEEAQTLRDALPGCRVLALPVNLGFARANNLGAAERPDAGSYLFVNSDAFVRGAADLSALRTALEPHDVGIVVPRLLDVDLRLQPSVRPFPGPGMAVMRATGLERLVPDAAQPRLGGRWTHDHDREIDCATGAVMLVRAAVWHRLDGFDESSFMYGEDIDLCWRARTLGWRTWFCAGAEFVHLGNSSGALVWDDAQRWERIGAAEAALVHRHLPPVTATTTLAALRAGLWAREVAWRVSGSPARAEAWSAQRRGHRQPPPDGRSSSLDGRIATLVEPLVAGDGQVVVLRGGDVRPGDLAPDAVLALVVPRGRRRRGERRAIAAGLESEGAFVVRAPRADTGTALIALVAGAGTEPWPSGRRGRLAAAVTRFAPGRRALVEALGHVVVLLRRPGAEPLAGWLAGSPPTRRACLSVRFTGAGGGTTVVRLGAAVAGERLVAKIRRGPGGARRVETESDALRLHGEAARSAGAVVPDAAVRHAARERHALVMPELSGTRAAEMLAMEPARAGDLLVELAGWLGRWNDLTARERRRTPESLATIVLDPARRLGLPQPSLDRLAGLCADCAGGGIAEVAAHGDLTAYNVLLGPEGRLAVIDWETSRAHGLPTTDLAYAALDVLRAARPDGDRLLAFGDLLDGDGPLPRLARRLLADDARSRGLSPPARDLCWNAGWLAHAADEAADPAGTRGSFGAIARIAAGREGAP